MSDKPMGYIADALHDASMDDLWGELKARFPMCVLTGMQESLGDSTSYLRICRYSGTGVSCIGLLEVMRQELVGLCSDRTEYESESEGA